MPEKESIRNAFPLPIGANYGLSTKTSAESSTTRTKTASAATWTKTTAAVSTKTA
jgi:hypothetical protein